MEELWKYWYANETILLFGSCFFFIVQMLCVVMIEAEYKKKWVKIAVLTMCILYVAPLTFLYVYTEYINPKIDYENALKFYTGDGFSPNLEIAIKAFDKAADNKHAKSCRILSDIYKSKKDIFMSIRYLKQGIKIGDAESAKMLGEFYDKNRFESIPKEKQLHSAYMAYSQALCLGDMSVRHRLNILRPHVSEATRQRAESDCLELKQNLEREI